MERITAEAVAAARAHVERRIGAIRAAIISAEDVDAALLALTDLAAIWTPDAFGALIDQALTLSALTGREDVMTEAEGGTAFAEPDFTRRSFREQIEFLMQKRPTVSKVWTDFMRGEHDRALVVAGVTDQAMIEEFATAIVQAAETYDIRAFGAEFDRLVAKYGWEYNGGREWRIRTIFETNIRTSYMAGRLKQMRDPDVVRLRPYWQYQHAATRIPLQPREQHVAWDGLVLDWDDPWWDIYFPPNDWKCSCGVRTLSKGDLKRLGKTGPDEAPEIVRRPYLHEASGEIVQLPEGTGFGWDYMPGERWTRALSPYASEVLPDSFGDLARNLVQGDRAAPIADLLSRSRPFSAPLMSDGLPPEDYARAFLAAFGVAPGQSTLWTDPAGGRILISEDLFRSVLGDWKAVKRGHGNHALLLAEAMLDPDEIWVTLHDLPDPSAPNDPDRRLKALFRSYVRLDQENAAFALFMLGRRVWYPVTAFGPSNRDGLDLRYLDRQRVGRLIWERK